METEYDDALHMMELQGGSFVKALAELYYRADSKNKPRVYAAFPEYFADYEQRWANWKNRRALESGGGES